MEKILAIGDVHFPWAQKSKISAVLKLAETFRPHAIVQVGDLYDMFAAGRWAKSLDIMTPKQEYQLARDQAEEFWRLLRRASPKSACFQLIGNHDERPLKRVLDKAPEVASLMKVDELFKFKGVKTANSEFDELVLKDIVFMHGYKSKLGDHATFNQMKTVCGHSHRGGVVFMPKRGTGTNLEMIWELNCGYLGDPDEVPLQYRKQSRTIWTHGVGLIDHLGPRFVPL